MHVTLFIFIVDSLDIWNNSDNIVSIGYQYRTKVTTTGLGHFNLSVYSFDNLESPHIRSDRMMVISKSTSASLISSPLTKRANIHYNKRYSRYGQNVSQEIKFMVMFYICSFLYICTYIMT